MIVCIRNEGFWLFSPCLERARNVMIQNNVQRQCLERRVNSALSTIQCTTTDMAELMKETILRTMNLRSSCSVRTCDWALGFVE